MEPDVPDARTGTDARNTEHPDARQLKATALNPFYFETRFRTDQPVVRWPAEFVIISAFATTGETWTSQQNEDADQRLASDLAARGVWLERVTGYSSSTGHAEPSWAVELSLHEACSLGLHFRQDAIYHVKNDRLSVTYCDKRRELMFVDSFRRRLDRETPGNIRRLN